MPPPGPSEHQFRENSRAPVAAPVRLQFDALEEPQDGHTANISVGGMFVEAKEPKPVGTLLRFELALGGGEPIKGVGEVVWIRARAQGQEAPAGMGIQFGHLDDLNRERLKEIVIQALGGGTELTEPTPRPPRERAAPRKRPTPEAAESPKQDRQRATPTSAGGSRTQPTRKLGRPGGPPARRADKGSDSSAFAMSGRAKTLIILLGLLALLLLLLT